MKIMVECSSIWRAVHELVTQIARFPDTDISLGAALDKCTSSASRNKFGGSTAACKTQSVLILTVSVRPWMTMKGQLSLPCAMLLRHPSSAEGSLTHPASPWVPVHAGTACGRAVGKGVICEIQRRRRLMTATERQQQTGSSSQAGGEQAEKLGDAASALGFPDPWHLRRGPVGRWSTHGCHGLIQQAAKHNTAAGSLPPPVGWRRKLEAKK